MDKRGIDQDDKAQKEIPQSEEEPMIVEEIDIEDLYVDGICGVY